MKKILIIFTFILLFINVNTSFGYSGNTTVIDCISGDDIAGEALNDNKPYRSLKVGIEDTISYINANINKVGNESTASGQIFNIKVNCTMKQMLDNTIKLDFLGSNYNNELIIEGSGANTLIFEDTKFLLSLGAGNIVFKNARFNNYNFPYFYDYIPTNTNDKSVPYSTGIKILDSYIKLQNGLNMGSTDSYKKFSYYNYPTTYYNYYNYYSNRQSIENSIIDIEVSGNYDFKLPANVKNSKINFFNKTGSGIYDILFTEEGSSNFSFSNFISNEINLGANNFSSKSSNNIAYINNKFSNFNNFSLGKDTIYLNNSIENNNSIIDITGNKNTYNNLFSGEFIDTFDVLNLRKNFNISNLGAKGIAWVFQKINNLKYFDIDTSSNKLYAEVTGKTIAQDNQSIYITY